MSSSRYRLLALLLSLAYLGIVLHMLFPTAAGRAAAQVETWAWPWRYRRWWLTLPTWKREALIVRGEGFPGEA